MMAAPGAFKFQHAESPLDNLVRRTSSRKPQSSTSSSAQPLPADTPPAQLPYPYTPQATPPKQQHLNQRPPSSPLLHSRFARDSTATASSNDNNSYLDTRSSIDSRNAYNDLQYHYYDDESIYSDPSISPAIRDSWQSSTSTNTLRPGNVVNLGNPAIAADMRFHRQSQSPSLASNSNVPTVVVSSPEDANPEYASGRAPITKPIVSNFSRPVRPPMMPALPSDEQKRRVLERNAGRTPSTNASRQQSSYARSPTESSAHLDGATSPVQRSTSPLIMARSPSPVSPGPSSPSYFPNQLSPSLSQIPAQGQTRSLSPTGTNVQTPDHITLPRGPPSVPGSPVSLYSSYSYYQLDSASPSPTNGNFQTPSGSSSTGPNRNQTPQPSKAPGPNPPSPQSPQDYLQLGIQHHEANRLKESAVCFEKSATNQGGCGVGMLMWGLTLRHGWGCEKNEKHGFKWLRRAAEHAVEDLEKARGGIDSNAVRTELIIAIYEVGQCFFQGWGVAKDQKMAVSYYTVAARLGDADAQSDLAFCLANGKGCKKDRKEAAKWYRAAVAQGQSDVGLAWIYKDKYQ